MQASDFIKPLPPEAGIWAKEYGSIVLQGFPRLFRPLGHCMDWGPMSCRGNRCLKGCLELSTGGNVQSWAANAVRLWLFTESRLFVQRRMRRARVRAIKQAGELFSCDWLGKKVAFSFLGGSWLMWLRRWQSQVDALSPSRCCLQSHHWGEAPSV